MSQSTKTAAAECANMTKLLASALDDARKAQDRYDDAMMDYQEKYRVYSLGRDTYGSLCSGNCARGGVVEHGCHPICTNWTRLHPEPTRPAQPIQPNFGTFVCQVCSQSVDINALASRDVNVSQNALKQLQTCTVNLAGDQGKVIAGSESTKKETTTTSTTSTTSATTAPRKTNSTTILWIIGIIIFVVIAVVIAIVAMTWSDDDEEYEEEFTS